MSVSFELNAQRRDDLGKGASRRLRRDGMVPAIVYGGDEAPLSVTLELRELNKNLESEAFYSHILDLKIDGAVQKVILRDLHRHPFKPIILHADLQRVDPSHAIRMRVPLHFLNEGTCVGVKTSGGVVSHLITEVEVSCSPNVLPEFIAVDLAQVELGTILHLSDLKLPEGVSLVELAHGEGHDQGVVSVHAPHGGVQAEA